MPAGLPGDHSAPQPETGAHTSPQRGLRHGRKRNPRLSTLIASYFISAIGSGAGGFAFAFVSYEISGSMLVAVLVSTMQAIPSLFLVRPAERLLGAFSLRAMAVVSSAMSVIVYGAAAVGIFAGYLSVALLLVISLLTGVVRALSFPVWNQMLRALAGTDDQPRQQPQGSLPKSAPSKVAKLDSVFSSASSLGSIIGIMVGGALLQKWGAGWLFVVNAASLVPGIIALLFIPGLGRIQGTASVVSLPGATRKLFADTRVRRIVLGATLLTVVAWPILKLLPGIAHEVDPSPIGYSILTSAFLLGSAASPMLVKHGSSKVGYPGMFGRAVLVAFLGLTAVAMSALLGPGTGHLIVLIIVLAAMGLALHVASAILDSSVQTAASPSDETALLAAYNAFLTFAYPVGCLVMSGIGDEWGVWSAVVVMAVGSGILLLVAWFTIGPELKYYSTLHRGEDWVLRRKPVTVGVPGTGVSGGPDGAMSMMVSSTPPGPTARTHRDLDHQEDPDGSIA